MNETEHSSCPSPSPPRDILDDAVSGGMGGPDGHDAMIVEESPKNMGDKLSDEEPMTGGAGDETPPTVEPLQPRAKKRPRAPKAKSQPRSKSKSKPVGNRTKAACKDATSKKKGTKDPRKSTTKNYGKNSAKRSPKAACKPKAKAKSKSTSGAATHKQRKPDDDWVKRKLHCVAQLPKEYVFFSSWIGA